MSNHEAITEGSTNVFADLGLPEADDLLIKARLALQITRIVQERNLTQTQAAELLDATQPMVSNLMNGQLHGFSMERLVRFLNALGRDVEIVLRPTPRSRSGARTTVRVAG